MMEATQHRPGHDGNAFTDGSMSDLPRAGQPQPFVRPPLSPERDPLYAIHQTH